MERHQRIASLQRIFPNAFWASGTQGCMPFLEDKIMLMWTVSEVKADLTFYVIGEGSGSEPLMNLIVHANTAEAKGKRAVSWLGRESKAAIAQICEAWRINLDKLLEQEPGLSSLVPPSLSAAVETELSRATHQE